jgi:hypothetical protein
MIRVGLIGEHPTDTTSIINLLSKKFGEIAIFFTLVKGVHGSNLDSQGIKRILRVEYETKAPELVIFIRDMDGLKNDKEKIKQRKSYFSNFNSVVDRKGILLLNIYELEALLLADIDVINDHYKVKLEAVEDCMTVPDPKGYLKQRVRAYSTGHNPDLFAKLTYTNLVGRCRYFKVFDTNLTKKFTSFSAS